MRPAVSTTSRSTSTSAVTNSLLPPWHLLVVFFARRATPSTKGHGTGHRVHQGKRLCPEKMTIRWVENAIMYCVWRFLARMFSCYLDLR